MLRKSRLLCYVFCSLACLASEQFQPSHEWKIIQPGQTIPAGIHVRHDFRTGITEGKIMDSKTNDNYAVETDTALDFRRNFKSSAKHKLYHQEISDSWNPESKVLDDLFKAYLDSRTEEESLLILEDIGDRLREYDNAVDFTNKGKLASLVSQLSSSSTNQSIGILSCLAAAIQGNPPVKLAMYQAGLLDQIVMIWRRELHSSLPDSNLISQCLLTVSAISRHFPLAQKAFFVPLANESSPLGFSLLIHTLRIKPISSKLKVRLFALLGDLLAEQNITGSTKEQKRLDQCELYVLTNLAADLPKYGFCQAAVSTLFDPDLTDNTSNRQRIMGAILHISRICSPSEMFPHKPEAKRRKVRKLFDRWIRETRKEAAEEAKETVGYGVNYYDELLRLLEDASYSILRLPETKQM